MIYNLNFYRRKNIRLKGYDYSQAGLYFITICVHNMKCIYGKIVDEEMILNDYGIIAYNEWLKLPERFPNMELDVFQIMPNHMHGIIALKKIPYPQPSRLIMRMPIPTIPPTRRQGRALTLLTLLTLPTHRKLLAIL